MVFVHQQGSNQFDAWATAISKSKPNDDWGSNSRLLPITQLQESVAAQTTPVNGDCKEMQECDKELNQISAGNCSVKESDSDLGNHIRGPYYPANNAARHPGICEGASSKVVLASTFSNNFAESHQNGYAVNAQHLGQVHKSRRRDQSGPAENNIFKLSNGKDRHCCGEGI